MGKWRAFDKWVTPITLSCKSCCSGNWEIYWDPYFHSGLCTQTNAHADMFPHTFSQHCALQLEQEPRHWSWIPSLCQSYWCIKNSLQAPECICFSSYSFSSSCSFLLLTASREKFDSVREREGEGEKKTKLCTNHAVRVWWLKMHLSRH